MDIKDAIPGREVVYTPYKGCSEYEKELGIITRVGREFVYVRYVGCWNSKATYPWNIEYSKGAVINE